MEMIWIRHGMTQGNRERNYIGITEEPLCEAGIADLQRRRKKGIYPEVDQVFVSPMKRCIETAQILYPNVPQKGVPGLQECDFGEFEGKNYQELCALFSYQEWIASNGTLPFPGGESKEEFQKRCKKAFAGVLQELKTEKRIAWVVHGGTIMSLLKRYGNEGKGYYDYQVMNGCGYTCVWDDVTYQKTKEIIFTDIQPLEEMRPCD